MSTSRRLSTPLAVLAAVAVLAAPRTATARATEPSRPPGRHLRAPPVSCTSCIVVDDADRVLLARHARRPLPNASTTKMVSALVVAAAGTWDDIVTVSPHAASTGGGGLDLRPGERYGATELLYAMLLTSSNDAAVALAEHTAGSEAAFVARMDDAARAAGARASRFVTPHGLDVAGHYSTARDLARIAAAVLARPRLARIVRTPRTTIAGPEGPLVLENRNPLLQTYSGAIGVKTGFTELAGEVLVAAAQRRGRRVIAVAMRSDDAARDASRLLDYGFSRLRHAVLLHRHETVGWLVFDPAGAAPATAARSVRGMSDPRAIEVAFEPDARARPPLAPGQRVGVVVVRAGGRVLGAVPAVAARAIAGTEPPDALEALGRLLRLAHRVGAAVAAW